MSTGDDAIERALRLLAEAAREESAKQARGHLLRVDEIELAVEVPLNGDLSQAASTLRADLRRAIEEATRQGAAMRPGHVVDLRTGEADAAPPDGRHIFAGYEANGAPRFLTFNQWLLDIGHPEQEKLYRQPPGLITLTLDADDIHGEVLPAFRPKNPAVRIRGQVVAGWFQVRHKDRTPGYLALTFQVLETGRKKKRFHLDIVGAGPDGEPLEEALTRLDEPPWRSATLWCQKALDSIRFKDTKKRSLDERIQGILGGLARRLHQVRRGKERRTGHAEQRHRDGARPTRMAFVDLERARLEQILFDRRRETLIVLGERGRAHVWSRVGKLVTSIRYTPDSIERKKKAEIWRPASQDEAETLRQAVARRGT